MPQIDSIPQSAQSENAEAADEALDTLMARTRKQINRVSQSEASRLVALSQFDTDLMTVSDSPKSQAIVCRVYLRLFQDR